MILVRQVFQVKFGQMDKVLAALRAISQSGADVATTSRCLTDISGSNFTLVFENKAESMDAYWETMQTMFADEQANAQFDAIMPYFESGYREFYTIEFEAEE